MKRGSGWILLPLLLGSLAVGCDLFSSPNSKSTIEVSNTYTGSDCNSFQATLDGNETIGIGNGSYSSFSATNAGSHTVVVSVSGGCPAACQFQNGSSSYSTTFNTTAGNVFVIKVSPGSSCSSLVVSGP